VQTPRGFSYAGIHCGIKAARKDLALVYSEAPCAAAGLFTVNAARAAPVRDAAARLPANGIRAIVANSGNANALVGPEGEADVRAVRTAVAASLGIDPGSVLAASTGVIGVRLPVQKLAAAAPALAAARGKAIEQAAQAIMTTDTRVKLAQRTLVVNGVEGTFAAFGKGSGMVAPELATVLAFITTDLAVTPSALQAALAAAVRTSFEMLTIDGDMSTNDAVFALANGMAGNAPIEEGTAEHAAVAETLESICIELARAVAEDGDGATKMIEVHVRGAPDVAIARDAARSIVGSNLVKASIFGADPNWGRVLSVLGARAGSRKWPVDPTRAVVTVQGTCVYDGRRPGDIDALALRAKMREPLVTIDVRLAEGDCEATAWGCDLSYDYVKINADYTSLTHASADGTIARDDRLTNYTPAFKRAILVEALSYIARFSNTRAVVKYGGAAMVKESLKASFANDINLLRTAGLLPVVVHGGGAEITHTLEELGLGKGEYGDTIRGTGREELKVVEMVLTGKVNTELVSLLNQSSAHAVGVSGKDAGLLRARKLVGEGGVDLGMVGEITSVNRELLDVLLERHYVPVVSPVGLGEDGDGYNINADAAAAEIAIAIKAEKLIYLTDSAGILENGELVSELSASHLRRKIADGTIKGAMVAKAKSVLRAIEGGVPRVHILDGRTPHSVIAELFTDRGVGTLVHGD
jgi:acetylglutamate kinase